MNKSVFAGFLLVTLSSIAAAQTGRGVHITSPVANQEICLSSSVPISAFFKNRDLKDHTLLVRFTIRNIVTGNAVYFSSDTIPLVAAGTSVNPSFPPYVTNPNILNQLGTFLVCASVTALDSLGRPITNWMFADSECVRIFGIRTTSLPFMDPSDNYNKTAAGGDIPDQTKWVSIGATVVEGDNETWDPPPPRYTKADGGVGPDTLFAPVIRMDRSDADGNLYTGSGIGDTLASFPFNLLGQTRCIISFDFMRGRKRQYPDLWDADTMAGPEQTVLNSKGNVVRPGDSLIVEFKDPSEPSCNPFTWNRIAGIDGGHDFEFQNFWMGIVVGGVTVKVTGKDPVFIPLDRNYLDSGFRFRLRLKENNNAAVAPPIDDDDPWYIDNLTLFHPNIPEIELKWVRVVTPYTKMPFSAMAALPVYLCLKNKIPNFAFPPIPVQVDIRDTSGNIFYSQSSTISSLAGGSDSVVRLPDWFAQDAARAAHKFIVTASITSSSYDDYTQDDRTYSTFYLNVDKSNTGFQEFAYDDASLTLGNGEGNDIPFVAKIKGAGIGFASGSGSYAMKFVLPQTDTILGANIYFASGNAAPDAIRISLLQGNPNSCIPGDPVLRSGSPVSMEDVRGGGIFDQFWPYFFPKPVEVPPGVYWLSVSQLSLNNMMVGGDLSRGSGEIIVADDAVPHIDPVYSSPYGTQTSPTQNTGDVSCAFAVETTAGSGNWSPWMRDSGYWPTNTGGNTNQAISWNPTLAAPFVRGGSFLPMIRVLIGNPATAGVQSAKGNPNEFAFAKIAPNPFSAGANSVELNFNLVEEGDVSLVIYDELGRQVKNLFDGRQEAGKHSLYWSGRDESGAVVAPGVYFCRLSGGSRMALAKMLVQ